MAKITWITANGESITADVDDGVTLMEAALEHGVPGVVGECGGGLMCATCHVYIEPASSAGEPGPIESDLLDAAESPRGAGSRLSCQLIAGPELDGLVVRVPAAV